MLLDANGNPISHETVSLKQLTFTELPRRLKVLFATTAAGVAATAILLANIQSILKFFSTPAPKLILVDTTISDDGYAPRVDLFVRNSGDAKAIITRARIEVIDEIRVSDFYVAPAAMDIDVSYDVTLSLGNDEQRAVIVDDFGRHVDPGEADRIRFNIQTNDYGRDLLLAYTFRVILTYNDSTELESASVTVAAISPMAFAYVDTLPDTVIKQLHEILVRLGTSPAQKGLAANNLERTLKKLVDAQG